MVEKSLQQKETKLTAAITFAVAAHAMQMDKQSHPYILHPLAVMLQMKTNEQRIRAVLHDVFEDCEVDLDEAKQLLDLNSEDVRILDALTHRKGEPYDDYLKRVIVAGPDAVEIKLADIDHNLSRMDGLPDEDRLRLKNKYFKAKRSVECAMKDKTT